MKMSRMQLTTDTYGRVTIAYTEALYDERVIRTFTCPTDGGYVRELLMTGGDRQPCDGLARTGNTLKCASLDALPALIRAEYRRMRAAERREMA
jgi:hypothetical protein